METYRLLDIKGYPLRVTIDECAKEDFKDMMKWTEQDWKRHTQIIRISKIKE